MSKKEISIIIRAKNAMAAGLASAGASLRSFGQSALTIGSFFTKAFIGAGAAIMALGVKAVSSFADAEKAENSAAAAFRAYGDEVDANVANVKRFAAAIMNETGVEDDNLVARAAQLRMLGVAPGQLEAATKATIALAAAGMGEEQAMKAVVGAMNGNFAALGKFLPALKETSSATEKAQIVNDFLTRGYAQQKDALNTIGGKWGQLKNHIGNAIEEVGAAIAQNGVLTGVIDRAGEAVKGLGDKISAWVASGGLQILINTLQLFGENVRTTFTTSIIYAEGFFMGGIYNPAKAAFQYVTTIIGTWMLGVVAAFQYVGGFAEAMWEKIKSPTSKFTPPDLSAWKESLVDFAKSFTGEFVDKVPNAFQRMNEKLLAESQRHAAKESAISAEQLAKYKSDSEKKVEAETKAQDELNVAKANNADEIEKLKKEEEKLNADLANAEKDAMQKRLDGNLDAFQKQQAAREELANKTIDAILEEQKAEEEKNKQDERNQRKAERLEKRMSRGAKLSKKDAKWLEAFNRINEAKGGLAAGAGNVAAAQQQIAALNDQGKKLTDIRIELEKVHGDLKNLLERG